MNDLRTEEERDWRRLTADDIGLWNAKGEFVYSISHGQAKGLVVRGKAKVSQYDVIQLLK